MIGQTNPEEPLQGCPVPSPGLKSVVFVVPISRYLDEEQILTYIHNIHCKKKIQLLNKASDYANVFR